MVCDNVRPAIHKSLSCLLGWCFMRGLRCHFISMSNKFPLKLEVTSRHDHEASNQTKKLLCTCMTAVQCALMHVLFVEMKKKTRITNVVHVYCFSVVSYEPWQEKNCLRGLRPGQTQTPCTVIEASWKHEFGMKERTCTFEHAPWR